MAQLSNAITVTADRSPAGGAGIELPLTQTTTGRLRVDVVASAGGGSSGLTTGQNALSVTAEEVIAANTSRRFAEVKNADNSINVYLGDDNTVTTANGHLLRPGEAFVFENYTGAIWAIAASSTPSVTFCEW